MVVFAEEGEDEKKEKKKSNLMRDRFLTMVRRAQDHITTELEKVDGKKFIEDSWTRAEGGGGWSRVLQDGNVFEKAGVNVSAVHGVLSPEAAKQMTSRGHNFTDQFVGKGPIKFFACGISLVIHPHNPMAPTTHANYRYFEIENPDGPHLPPVAAWFGGGADLTPSYLFEDDAIHFHSVLKKGCDVTDVRLYPRFKKWCDDYFYIPHRKERRGVGGIFYDDLTPENTEGASCVNCLFNLAERLAMGLTDAYIPIVRKRKDMPFTPEQKQWQQLRRGRYVEFNLVIDRGTKFGLQTNGRIESILMSLPLTARWQYDHHPVKDSPEDKLLQVLINPVDWIPLTK